MSKIIDRAGSGASITPTENDSNLDSLHGINQVIAGATHTVDITDQGDTLEFTNAGAVAVTLDSIATIQGAAHTSDFHITLIATNAATVATITPNGANSFNTGVATIVLTVDEYVTLETDSTGLVWNIKNNSDSLKVGGLSASQFLRSDADDTTTGNISISKANPTLLVKCADEATENAAIQYLDELANLRAIVYRPAGADFLRLDVRTALGVVGAALDITESGKVNIIIGTLQLAGADVTSTAAELNILDGVTSTAAELNIMDGDTVQATVTLAGTDGVVVDDAGIMKQCLVSDFPVYARSVTETLTNKTLTSPVINTGVSGTAGVKGIFILDNPETLYDSATYTSGVWTSSSGLASTTLSTAGATAAIVRLFVRMHWTTDTDVFAVCGLRKAGEVDTGIPTYIDMQRANLNSNALNQVAVCGEGTVALDASSDFELYFSWDTAAGETIDQNFTATLIGYYV